MSLRRYGKKAAKIIYHKKDLRNNIYKHDDKGLFERYLGVNIAREITSRQCCRFATSSISHVRATAVIFPHFLQKIIKLSEMIF